MSSSTTSDLRPHFQSTIRQITFQPRPPSSDRTPARSTPNSKHSTVDPDCDSVDDPNTTVTITIRELLDPDYGSYIWPSALVLSQFLWDNRKWLFGFVGNRGFSRRSRAGRDVGGKEKQGKESGGSVNALSLLATYTDEDSEDDESEVDDQCGEGGKGRRLAQLDQEQPKQAQDSPQLPSPPGDLSQIFTSLPVRNVLELGCGTALPGLLSYALGARRVLLTDRPEGTHVLDNVKWHIQQNLKQRGEFRDDIAVNGMGKQEEGEITVTPLRWGDFVPSVAKLGSFLGYKSLPRRTGIEQGQRTIDLDLIIGADVFYDPKDFDDLLATVAFILSHSPDHCVFLTAYQERSSKRCVQWLLDKWGLEGRRVHFERERSFESVTCGGVREDQDGGETDSAFEMGAGFDSVFLFVIKRLR